MAKRWVSTAVVMFVLVGASPAFSTSLGPGVDLLALTDGRIDPVMPADFFDPGSDPFSDSIGLGGNPTGPADTDTIVERLGGTTPPFDQSNPGPQPISIELVELSLVSLAPITVTYAGGSTENWDVAVTLSPTPAPLGQMTVTHEQPNGGSYTATLPVLPRLVFTRQSDGMVRMWDPPTQQWDLDPTPWSHTCPPLYPPNPPHGEFCPIEPITFHLSGEVGGLLTYGTAAIPLPAAAWMGVTALGAMGLVRFRRRK